MNEEIVLKIKDVSYETHDTITIKFHKNYYNNTSFELSKEFENNILHYVPGQYLNLKISLNEKVHYRAYSLSSCPSLNEDPSITIKRVDKGLISNYLLDNIKSINYLISHKPKGNFIIRKNVNNFKNIVFIAAGSGITPIFSIIKTILNDYETNITLIYTNRDSDNVIFKNTLQQFKEDFRERFNYIQFLTRSKKHINDSVFGRPDYVTFKNIFENYNNLDTNFYLCGPLKMMENAYKALYDLNISDDNIFWESFGNEKSNIFNKSQSVNLEQKNNKSKVKINFEDKIYNILVDKNQTILDVALDEEIDLPFACSNGTCNVCQAKCKKGKIQMENDEGLTEEELEENYILTCVAKPISDEIEIEIP